MAAASDSDDDGATSMALLLPNFSSAPQDSLPPPPPPPAGDEYNHHRLTSIPATLTTRQFPSQGLSFQLWPAAASLVALLDHNPSLLRLPPSPLRILELGSGTGLLGLAAAALLGAHVTLSDLPHVLPNLRFNALANASTLSIRGGCVSVEELTWGAGDGNSAADLGFDVVMASDVVYYDHLFEPLLETMREVVKGEVVFVMAHLRRWNKRDGVFFRKARKVFEVEVVHKDAPVDGGGRVGVVVYRFMAKACKV